jgi:hypothetical protein
VLDNLRSEFKINLLVAIIIAIFIFLLSFWYSNNGVIFRKRGLKKAMEWATGDSIRIADSLKRIEIGVVAPIGSSLYSINKKSVTEISEKNKAIKYHIIVGSFSVKGNALRCMREYLVKGYNAELIYKKSSTGNNVGLVSVKSFHDFDETREYLKNFQRDLDSEAWIYVIK